MRFDTLTDWLHWLEHRHPTVINLGLQRISQLAQALGVDSFSVPVITVAGTNGKGSSIAMLRHIYQAAGFRVATYTSPHLLDFRERVSVNGQCLSEANWCQAMAQIDALAGSDALSYFEFTVLAGLLLIAQQQSKLDVILLEVGLGGRLDAINAVQPWLSVITSIALDHTEYLGTTREAIGYEKAGIFRHQRSAVCGDPNPPQSILTQAEQLQAPLSCQARDFHYVDNADHWQWSNQQQQLTDLPRPNLPLQNAATVLQVVDLMQAQLPTPITAIRQGLASTTLAGRFQILQQPHHTIIDVAHNPHAASYLATQLANYPHQGRYLAVVGLLNSKDLLGTLTPLLPQIDHWFCATMQTINAVSADVLAAQLRDQGALASVMGSVSDAYQGALTEANADDIIVVLGSFYNAAEVLTTIKEAGYGIT